MRGESTGWVDPGLAVGAVSTEHASSCAQSPGFSLRFLNFCSCLLHGAVYLASLTFLRQYV